MSASLSGQGDGRPSVPTNRTLSSVNSTTPSTELLSTSTYGGVHILEHESASTQDTKSNPEPHMIVPDESHELPSAGKSLQEVLLSADLKNIFSRASNLIREATDVNGVAIFDASISFSTIGSEHASMND